MRCYSDVMLHRREAGDQKAVVSREDACNAAFGMIRTPPSYMFLIEFFDDLHSLPMQ